MLNSVCTHAENKYKHMCRQDYECVWGVSLAEQLANSWNVFIIMNNVQLCKTKLDC